MSEKSALSGPAQIEQEDLVVSSPDVPLLMARLRDRDVHPTETIDDPVLGLTRLRKLAGLAAAAPGIKSDHAAEIAFLEKSGRTFTDLDALLLDVRRRFEHCFGGWVPSMGKNREVRGVLPQPGGGGGKVTFTVEGAGRPQAVGPPNEVPQGPEGADVVIGMVDTPLIPHRRLAGHVDDGELIAALFGIVEQEDAPGLAGRPLWAPWQGHATFVVDRALHEAPSARFMVKGALDGEYGGATAWETAQAIAGFAGTGIAILNLSIGARTGDGKPPLVLTRAIELLGSQVLVIAAAGNHNKKEWATAPMWPAALPNVVAVGATDAAFSPELPWVTCTADGHEVVGAYLSGSVVVPAELRADDDVADSPESDSRPRVFEGFARWSGTSFAAATVSGAVAAAMTGGRTAREAFEELLDHGDPNGVVKKYVHQS